jgi:hypothetical protein
MTSKEILDALNANVGKRVRITLDDGVVQSVDIDCVDDEGFLHSGRDGNEPRTFWTRFEGVRLLEPDSLNQKGETGHYPDSTSLAAPHFGL